MENHFSRSKLLLRELRCDSAAKKLFTVNSVINRYLTGYQGHGQLNEVSRRTFMFGRVRFEIIPGRRRYGRRTFWTLTSPK